MGDASAAAVAFFALGVTFFGTALLLLFNPRSRGVRWFAFFQLSILTWLFAQGWAYATGDWDTWRPVLSGAVHLAPGLFLAFALIETVQPRWMPLAVIALGVALLPVDLASANRHFAEPVLVGWNVVGWSAATLLFMRMMKRYQRIAPHERRMGRIIVLLMCIVFPMGLVSGMVSRGALNVYLMPLAMVWIQGLIFVGVARLRFYDIEVRAARTGDIAAAAAEQERLAVVGELSATLAHEIRNPLTGVRSLAQRLAEEEIEPAKRQRYASVILEEVGRVERLVANLLGLAKRAPRAGTGDERTPLAPLFDDLALLVSGRADRAKVKLVADAGELSASSPREPLAQALLNLLLNAIAHSPAGGTVTLQARQEQGAMVLAVRDQGPGVPAEERERIWQPFHTSGSGTGLGLAVVSRLAREQGWTAEVGDAPGGGAEFRVVMPSPAAAASSPTARTLPAPEPSPS
ncbi:MAG TPA: ATP-binding protein [Longimicrobium sp.]|nr:ATP-binding protein [Longimicrobium sp.]